MVIGVFTDPDDHGPTINAVFPGQCDGCGRHYHSGALIHHVMSTGWLLVGCCA